MLNRACEYSDEDFSSVVECQEAASSIADLQKFRAECIEDDGVLAESCPEGEKISCVSEEDEFKDISIKFYANGSDDISKKGGGCGPYKPEPEVSLSTCAEFPELPASLIKLSKVCEAMRSCPNGRRLPSCAAGHE